MRKENPGFVFRHSFLSTPLLRQDVFFTFCFGNQHRTAGITEYIYRGAEHIQDTVHRQDQSDRFGRQTDRWTE